MPPANSMPRGMPLVDDHGDAGEDHDPGQRDGVPAPAEEIEVGVLENLHGV